MSDDIIQRLLDAIPHQSKDNGLPTILRQAKVMREAATEIEKQRADNERLRAKIKWLIEDDERLHYVLYRIANPPPFADCPVEMAQNATRGEHLRREAFDGIRRALEGEA